MTALEGVDAGTTVENPEEVATAEDVTVDVPEAVAAVAALEGAGASARCDDGAGLLELVVTVTRGGLGGVTTTLAEGLGGVTTTLAEGGLGAVTTTLAEGGLGAVTTTLAEGGLGAVTTTLAEGGVGALRTPRA